jgi:exopolysaccharide biosynthesis WecB/TagA/CpsF family protein
MQLLGIDFADLATAEAAAVLAARPADTPFGYVVTPNADHLVRLERQPALMPLYSAAIMRLLDSRVVARAAQLLGLGAPAVTPGADLTAELLSRHLRPGERVTIIGMDPAMIPGLVQRCGIAAPAHHFPPMGFETDATAFDAAVRFVIDHPARFIFLAVGSPRQEQLAAAIQRSGQARGIGLCVGASLEFLAGGRPRAPRWVQMAGFEWLHRLIHDPYRLGRRYLIDNPPIFALLLRERMRLPGRQSANVAPGQ